VLTDIIIKGVTSFFQTTILVLSTLTKKSLTPSVVPILGHHGTMG
jgi:hypothetical protein